MADMIEAKDAKKLLGCDDATLNNFVNSGQIKAQRVGGKLMLNKADVEKLKAKEDDGTIVLTGDSDDLSIDLGKVVDDSAETIVTKKATDTAAGTESITFGEDLEVVSFDDNSNTGELVFDENKGGKAGGQNLSFTDSNTAVMTAVDETAVGATTQPVEFQTGANEPARPAGSGSARVRSARSQRAAAEEAQSHWFWSACLVVTLLIGVFFVVPYYFIALFPHGEDTLANKDRRLGLDDNAWTGMAGAIAGFTVEPSKDAFFRTHGKSEEYTDITTKDPQAKWRYQAYRGKAASGENPKAGDRLNDFTFELGGLSEDGNSAKAKSGTTYTLRERTIDAGGGRKITEKLPDPYPGDAK